MDRPALPWRLRRRCRERRSHRSFPSRISGSLSGRQPPFRPRSRRRSRECPRASRNSSAPFSASFQIQRGLRLSSLHIPIQNTTLKNGLRVIVAPDATAPVVTVGVYYKIGFRLEPQGRSGFAHLFEHMMFQGSENAPKMQHIKLINSSGGVLNGSTMYDVTNYYEAVPSNALGRVLWLEADRMRALKVDDENLRNQRDVVKEEVRVNVLNQPYGGFPRLDMPPAALRNWANPHNFYGDFHHPDAPNLAHVQKIFQTYYLPHKPRLPLP